jgi:hypothetical protein
MLGAAASVPNAKVAEMARDIWLKIEMDRLREIVDREKKEMERERVMSGKLTWNEELQKKVQKRQMEEEEAMEVARCNMYCDPKFAYLVRGKLRQLIDWFLDNNRTRKRYDLRIPLHAMISNNHVLFGITPKQGSILWSRGVNEAIVYIMDEHNMMVEFKKNDMDVSLPKDSKDVSLPKDSKDVSLPKDSKDGQHSDLGLPMKISGEVLLEYLDRFINWVDEKEEGTVLARLEWQKEWIKKMKDEEERKKELIQIELDEMTKEQDREAWRDKMMKDKEEMRKKM